jgi:hypothetical protein
MHPETSKPAFAIDGMLAGLTKWLRILGFFAVFTRDINEAKKILPEKPELYFITSSMKHFIIFDGFKRILLTDHNLSNQLQTIDEQTGIFSKINLLSICTKCNTPVEPVDNATLIDKIPEKVKDNFDQFLICPSCTKIYWKGGHVERIIEKLKRMQVPIA